MNADAGVEIQGLLICGTDDERRLIIHAIVEAGVANFSIAHAWDIAANTLFQKINNFQIYFIHHVQGTEVDSLYLIERIRLGNPVSEIILIVDSEDQEFINKAKVAGCSDYLQKLHLKQKPLARIVSHTRSRINALEEVTKLNAKFSLIEKAANAGTWDWDFLKDCLIWSDQQCRLFNVDPEADKVVSYDTWRSAIHPDDIDLVEAELGSAILGHATFDIEFRVIQPSQVNETGAPAIRWLHGMGLVQRDASGAAIRMTGINFDISAKKSSLLIFKEQFATASKVQKRTANAFHAHFDAAPQCMFQIGITDNGRLVYEAINPAGLEHGGLILENFLGKAPDEVLGPDVGGAILDGLRSVYKTHHTIINPRLTWLPGLSYTTLSTRPCSMNTASLKSFSDVHRTLRYCVARRLRCIRPRRWRR